MKELFDLCGILIPKLFISFRKREKTFKHCRLLCAKGLHHAYMGVCCLPTCVWNAVC